MLNYRDMPGPGDFLPPECRFGYREPDYEEEVSKIRDQLLSGEKVAFGNGVIQFDDVLSAIADELGEVLFRLVNASRNEQAPIVDELVAMIKDSADAEARAIV